MVLIHCRRLRSTNELAAQPNARAGPPAGTFALRATVAAGRSASLLGLMPIVDVTIVVGRDEKVTAGLTQTLADGVGRVLNSPPGQTWVRLHLLAHHRYAENNSHLNLTDLPVFVVMLTRQLPDQSQLVGTIAELTQAISEATGRPSDRVHIEYAPSAIGRVAFGGKLMQ